MKDIPHEHAWVPAVLKSQDLDKIVSTMGATGPTTRSTFSLYEFRARSLDPVAPGIWFLCGCNPANPLIARKRRYIFPCSECRWDRNKGFS